MAEHGNADYVEDRGVPFSVVIRGHRGGPGDLPLGRDAKGAMGEMAVKAARAVGHVGAGTVECLVDADENSAS